MSIMFLSAQYDGSLRLLTADTDAFRANREYVRRCDLLNITLNFMGVMIIPPFGVRLAI
ncbi:hypothetical protein Dd703_3928 [Musicola paradisiaca Ech703]|uniref:Uncharacterized protein n=1 Tax=Musicola paradisiaca (strain Ech703) TaxID=579405 RepID=C6C672_MUSP7|nr:hypothetical protein Dd703_3928 [Musicola paradisiaca Ech703]